MAGKVPPKLWVEQVAALLEPADLAALGASCRLGRAVAADEELWKYWTLRQFGTSAIAEYVACSWRVTYARLSRRAQGVQSACTPPGDGEPSAAALCAEPQPAATTPYLHPDPWFFNRWIRSSVDVSSFEPGWPATAACAAERSKGGGMQARPGGGFPLQSVVLDVEAHLDASTGGQASALRGVPFYPSPRPPYCDVIPRLPLHAYPAFFTPARFRRDFEQASCPVLFPDAVKDWPAYRHWHSIDALAATTGAEPRFALANRVGALLGLEDEPMRLSASLAEYCAHIRGKAQDGGAPLTPGDELPLYIFDPGFAEKAPVLLSHYNVKPSLRVFEEDLFEPLGKARRPDFRWIVVGPGRSGTPWHIDPNSTSAWNALLAGRKRWALYPPGVVPPGVSVKRDGGGRVLEFACAYTAVQWYTEVLPTLQPRERPLEVLQRAGDVIFIPSGWWHMVLNLEETVSVTQNYVSLANLPNVMADVQLEEWDSCKPRGATGVPPDAHGVPSDPTVPPHHLRGLTGAEAWKQCLLAAADAAEAAAAAAGAPPPRLSRALLSRAFELSCSYLHAYDKILLPSSAALERDHRAARVAARAAARAAAAAGNSSSASPPFSIGSATLPRLLPLTEDLGLKARYDAQLPEIGGQRSFASHEHFAYCSPDAQLFYEPLRRALTAAAASAGAAGELSAVARARGRIPALTVLLASPGGQPYITAKALTSRANPTFGVPGDGAATDSVVVKFFSPCIVAGNNLAFDPARAFAAWQSETALLRALSASPAPEGDPALTTLPVATPLLLAAGYAFAARPGTERGWVPQQPPPLPDDPAWEDVGVFGGAAPLAADGSGWVWPYIVMTAVAGKPLGATLGPWGDEEEEAAREDAAAAAAAAAQASKEGDEGEEADDDEEEEDEDARAAAIHSELTPPLASLLARLHVNTTLSAALAAPPSGLSPLDAWRPYLAHLADLRRTAVMRLTCCRLLPPHLLAQVEHFLPPAHAIHTLLPPPVAAAFEAAAAGAAAPPPDLPAPAVLHCDLNLDNVMALPRSAQGAAWPYAVTGLIDFADARLGDPLYDCIPIHGGTFRFSAAQLERFLQAYAEARAALPASPAAALPASLQADPAARYRAMCLTLLFPVDAFRLLTPEGVLEAMEGGEDAGERLRSGSSSQLNEGEEEEDEEEVLSAADAVQHAFQSCSDLHATMELLFGKGLQA